MRIMLYRGALETSIPPPPLGARLLAFAGACPCCADPSAQGLRGTNPELGPGFGEVSADATCACCGAVVGRLRVSDEETERLPMRARIRITQALALLPFFERTRTRRA